MKWLLLLTISSLFAQSPPSPLTPKMQTNSKVEQKQPKQPRQMEHEEKKPQAIPMDLQSKSVILIDPKTRAQDLKEAFNLLRKEKPTLKVMVLTTVGTFMGVTDLSVSQGGTLIFLKYFTNQGSQTQVVPIEQLLEINYLP